METFRKHKLHWPSLKMEYDEGRLRGEGSAPTNLEGRLLTSPPLRRVYLIKTSKHKVSNGT